MSKDMKEKGFLERIPSFFPHPNYDSIDGDWGSPDTDAEDRL